MTMSKLLIKLTNPFYMLFFSILLSNTAFADPIGELVTTDGYKFELSQFGSKENQKNYYLKTTDYFIPIENVRHITRVDTQAGRFAYLIVLLNGEYETGRQGLLFYENVSYTDPSNGKEKSAFTPVIKDRQQSGLIFTALVNSENNKTTKKLEKVIEISYPNNIDRISLNYAQNNAQGNIKENSNQKETKYISLKN